MKLGLAAKSHTDAPRLIVPRADGLVIDVLNAADRFGIDHASQASLSSPKSVIAAGRDAFETIGKIVMACEGLGGKEAPEEGILLREEGLVFQPPIPDPGKFLCVGKNYRAHLDELVREKLIRELPKEPTGFIKLNSVLVGQNAEVARPDGIVTLDYEPELAFVIGRRAHKVSRADAMDYVAGITLFNDLTAREIQKREVESGTRFWTAKNMPGFGPVGPYIATLDEVRDVNDLWISCRVNGEERHRFNTRDQINKIPDIIEHFSRYLPLEPGDIFSTGSAAGTAFAQPNAEELYLKPGDVMDIQIEGLLTLTNRIV
jgi:2-keto-4-pentenoate hydratase/2-oxohepta-3-ene-1,7-dioic acid hydratase in catechol pathway